MSPHVENCERQTGCEGEVFGETLLGFDLRVGCVETSGFVSPPTAHPQVASMSAVKKWKLRSFETRNAFL